MLQLSVLSLSYIYTICHQVMEKATDIEKAMAVSEFLDSKRKNKVCTPIA
jgi:hypothetical protein